RNPLGPTIVLVRFTLLGAQGPPPPTSPPLWTFWLRQTLASRRHCTSASTEPYHWHYLAYAGAECGCIARNPFDLYRSRSTPPLRPDQGLSEFTTQASREARLTFQAWSEHRSRKDGGSTFAIPESVAGSSLVV
ncbi:hypothetical protein CLAIMM_09353, partial [Cladophialophora immunda]